MVRPCRMVAPILDELADEYEGRVTICKVNTEDFEDIASRYGVKGIPTFILLKDGQAVDKMVGVMPKSSFNSFLERNLRYD